VSNFILFYSLCPVSLRSSCYEDTTQSLPKKPHKRNLTFDMPCLQKLINIHAGLEPKTSGSPNCYSTNAPHLYLYIEPNYETKYIFSSNFTTSVTFSIIKSKAKIFIFDVKLLLIKRDDFFRANISNFTFYTEHAGEE
jgi:hypothetical protein